MLVGWMVYFYTFRYSELSFAIKYVLLLLFKATRITVFLFEIELKFASSDILSSKLDAPRIDVKLC